MGVAQNSSVPGWLGMMWCRGKGNVTWPWEGLWYCCLWGMNGPKEYFLGGIGQKKRGSVVSYCLCVCVCVCSLRMIQMNVCTVQEWTWRHGGQACGCGVGKERGTDGECQVDYCT